MSGAGWLALIAAVTALAAGLVLLPPEWVAAADRGLAAWRPMFGILRAAAIVAAWAWWDALVALVPDLSDTASAYLRSRRNFWVGMLAAVELVLVRNLPGVLWRWAT